MSQSPAEFGYPSAPPTQRPTETMAILALVFAFVFAPLGIVFGVIGRKNIARNGNNGRGLATAGMWLGIVFTALAVAYIVLIVVLIASGSVPALPATDVLVREVLGAVLLVLGLTGTIVFGLRLFRELPIQNQHRARLAGLSARERRTLTHRLVRGETVGLPDDQVRAQVQLFYGQRHLLGSQLSVLLILVAAALQALGNDGVFGGFGVFLIGLYAVAFVLVVASSVLLGRQVAAGRRYLHQH